MPSLSFTHKMYHEHQLPCLHCQPHDYIRMVNNDHTTIYQKHRYLESLLLFLHCTICFLVVIAIISYMILGKKPCQIGSINLKTFILQLDEFYRFNI